MPAKLIKKELPLLLSVFTAIYIILQIVIYFGNDTALSRYFWLENKNVPELMDAGIPQKSDFTPIARFISDQHFWLLRTGLIVTIILAFFYKNRNMEYSKLFFNITISVLLLLLINSGILTWILKICIGKPRPYTAVFEYVHFSLSTRYHSFPSGHTTETFSYIIPYIYFIRKPVLMIMLFLYGIFVTFTRVILSYHYITDVLFAIYITSVAGWLICSFIAQKRPIKHTG